MSNKAYTQAGVNVEAGYEATERYKAHAKSTHDKNVLGGLGSFGGFYTLENFKYKKPVLVAGTDGVGTKLKYAFAMDKFNTVGIDCVAMCVNDVVCQGAKPLFFLDYLATGKLVPEQAELIVAGIAEGCRQAGCSLIGGETAEMPGFYGGGEFDLAGFSTGIVEKSEIINGANIKSGDVLVGLPSSGAHSNGFSLIRKLFDPADITLLNTYSQELGGKIGDILLTPTRIYVKQILSLMEKVNLKGIAHITGGGFIENIPRILPSKDLGIRVNLNSYKLPPLFELILQKGAIDKNDAYNTFNMGIGMVIAVDSKNADKLVKEANIIGEKAVIIGEVTNKAGIVLE
ncbi:MAG: phosphoribosylformylglycinamidine cyclo-ligase [Firmicutes bacterium]|nr:phosphoribosylformylglycinamidine cyclo-ligase [Bacillota bacterium]